MFSKKQKVKQHGIKSEERPPIACRIWILKTLGCFKIMNACAKVSIYVILPFYFAVCTKNN